MIFQAAPSPVAQNIGSPKAPAGGPPSLADITRSMDPDTACSLILTKINNTLKPFSPSDEAVYRTLLKDCFTQGPGLTVSELSSVCNINLTEATSSVAALSTFIIGESQFANDYGKQISLIRTSERKIKLVLEPK